MRDANAPERHADHTPQGSLAMPSTAVSDELHWHPAMTDACSLPLQHQRPTPHPTVTLLRAAHCVL